MKKADCIFISSTELLPSYPGSKSEVILSVAKNQHHNKNLRLGSSEEGLSGKANGVLQLRITRKASKGMYIQPATADQLLHFNSEFQL